MKTRPYTEQELTALRKFGSALRAASKNYRPMVQVDNQWVGNALVFATKEEAEGNVRTLMWNWTAITDVRVDETDEPVNYRWVDGKLERVT